MKKFTVLFIAIILIMSVMLTGCAKKSSLKVIDIKLTDEEYAIAVNKNKPELLSSIDAILTEMKSDGTLDNIASKYFSDSGDAPLEIEIPSTAPNGAENALVFATSADFPPFESKNGSKYTGIDIEIAVYLAGKLGKDLVIMDSTGNFDAVLIAVGSGIVDMALAGITYSDTRAATIDFTQSYYYASQVVVVKDDNKDFDDCKTIEDVENVLKASSGKKGGYQSATTGEIYLKGDLDDVDGFGFAGFSNIERVPYGSGSNAATDLMNGNIDYLILDELPAKAIVKKLNANNK